MDTTINAYQRYLNLWESLDKAIESAQQLERQHAPAKAIQGAWDAVTKLETLKDEWKRISDAEFEAEEAAERAEQAAAVAAAEAIIAGMAA